MKINNTIIKTGRPISYFVYSLSIKKIIETTIKTLKKIHGVMQMKSMDVL